MSIEYDLIVEHALASKSNLEVACAVRASFDAIERKIVLAFLDQLQTRLKGLLGSEWTVSIGELSKPKYRYLVVGKKNWVDCRPIVLEKTGHKVFIGIPKAQPCPALSEKDQEEIRDSLRKGGESLQPGDGATWVAWNYIQHKVYFAWNHTSPQALQEMAFGILPGLGATSAPSDVVTYFANLIKRWADAVSPVLDRCYP
jgi:hypothetical protein